MCEVVNNNINDGIISVEPLKKKRGRPRKNPVNIKENSGIPVEKKKRGRPKKEPKKFPEYMTETLTDYISTYKDIIDKFISYSNDSRINKTLWDDIHNHVEYIRQQLFDKSEGAFMYRYFEYTFRSDGQWRSIDQIRENKRKEYVKAYYDMEYADMTYKSYMIWYHLYAYIEESSKEMKV